MKRGFSLIELLLVIVLISVAAGMSIPVFMRMQTKNDLDVVTKAYVDSLDRAQKLTISGESDSSWAVKYQTNKITIYKGTVFASRTTTFDEDFDIPSTITATGLTDIYFNRLVGNPSSTGNIVISKSDGESRTISINEKGIITY